MSGPDRIWARVEGKCTSGRFVGSSKLGGWRDNPETELFDDAVEYIRRDSTVLGALPEVQELIKEAYNAGWNAAIDAYVD